MEEKIIIDMLCKDSCNIKKQKTMIVDGEELELGLPWRRSYMNSVEGRKQVQEEVPEPYLTSIMSVWGEKPTITE